MRVKSVFAKCALLCLTLALALAAAVPAVAGEIRVGGLFDMTGPTSDVGADYAQGAIAAVKYVNEHGGIDGDKLVFYPNDYAYKIPEAVALYKKYRSVNKVYIVQGWGTGDTNALRRLVNRQNVVFMSASYDCGLADPKKTPYNFFIGTDYSTTIRLAMQFAKAGGAKKVMFLYPDVPYGKNPIKAGRSYAKEIGLEVGPDQIVPLRALDATSQLLAVKKFGADFVWLGNTTSGVAVILKDAAKLGLKTRFVINPYGFDRNLPKLAGKAAVGRAFGMMPAVALGAEVPGMAAVTASLNGKTPTYNYVKSWVSVMVMAEALKRAKKAGQLNGPGLKAALETLRDFDTGGLTAPISYTDKDHRPNTALSIYTINEDLKLVKVKDAAIERRPEHLGW